MSVISEYDSCYIAAETSYILDPHANGFRLPTEAEWEYACRAGSTGDYSGDGILENMGYYNSNSGYKLFPVGEKKANAFGLHDTHGNVWEWCNDFYAADYYTSDSVVDPSGPENGTRHVIRGGSVSNGEVYARSANRSFPDSDYSNCGLRIVRDLQ
jgi:sulfatase modifying factor 1